MKIAYTTLEGLCILVWLGSFLASCVLAGIIPFWGFLTFPIFAVGFLAFLIFTGEIVDKGYDSICDDIEITRRGIERKK